ncbi:MAG: class I SAM-dependent methyltransferase [Candidatus Zixiibacteriota bacterium]
MKKSKKPYQHMASLYDGMNMDRFAINMFDYASRILRKFKHKPRNLLELCCGTGTFATMFAEQGLEVTGVDGSREMLKQAIKKAKSKKLKIDFRHQMLPKLSVREAKGRQLKKFDLATCNYDSMNYLLTEADLKECFRRVAEHLNPGGYFIFDMNTYRAFKKVWIKYNYSGFRDDLAWVWSSKLHEDEPMVTLTAVFFNKKGRHWVRTEEKHTERAYPHSVIKRFLKSAGFEIAGFYRAFKFHKPDRKTGRISVVARKKS